MRTQDLQRIGNADKALLEQMAREDGVPRVALLHRLITQEWVQRKNALAYKALDIYSQTSELDPTILQRRFNISYQAAVDLLLYMMEHGLVDPKHVRPFVDMRAEAQKEHAL